MRLKLEGRSLLKWALVALATIVVLALMGFFTDYADFAKTLVRGGTRPALHVKVASGSNGDHVLQLPEILLKKGIYDNTSFVNANGVVPAFWQGETNHSLVVRDRIFNYGPCYSYDHAIDWAAEIAMFNSTGEPQYNEERIIRTQALDLQGYCRPGFIIIGMCQSCVCVLRVNVGCRVAHT